MVIAWTPEMATGARTLDDDHRRIVDRSNALLAAVAERAAPADVDRAIRSLGDTVLRHFTRDEDCAVRGSCPALDLNGEAHAEVIAILARFRLAYERSGAAPESAAEFEREIGAWLARYVPGPFGDRLPCIPLG